MRTFVHLSLRLALFLLALCLFLPLAGAEGFDPCWYLINEEVTAVNLLSAFSQTVTIPRNAWVYSAPPAEGGMRQVTYLADSYALAAQCSVPARSLTPVTWRNGEIGLVSNPQGTAFLNLRATPSLSAKVLGYYYNGVPCLITDRSHAGWYGVEVDGVTGYFSAAYVTPAAASAPFVNHMVTVSTPDGNTLNLRQGPGRQYGIIRRCKNGEYLMLAAKGVSQQEEWWCVITTDGVCGFISAEFALDGVYTPSGDRSLFASSGASVSVPMAEVRNPKVTQVLNLREQPDTSSRVLGQFSNGTRFPLLAQGMEWCQVQLQDGGSGYMMTDYLRLYNAPAIPTRRVSHTQRSYVNLRSYPGKASDNVLLTIPHGAEVTVMIPGSEWVKVRYNGQTGWLMAYFLE